MVRMTGFTVLELMATVTIAVILAAVGIPSFVELVRNNRIATTTNSFVSAIHSARIEAIRRNVPISICSSLNATDAAPSCDGGAGYEDGWVVFAEVGGGEPDGDIDADDVVIAAKGSIRGRPTGQDPSLSIRGRANFANRVSFRPNGLVQNSLGGTVSVCDKRGTSKSRDIVLAVSGRPRLVKGQDTALCAAT